VLGITRDFPTAVGRAAHLHSKALLCLERALMPLLFVLSPPRPWTRSQQSWEFFPCSILAFLLLLLQGAHFISTPHSAAYTYTYTYISTYVYIYIYFYTYIYIIYNYMSFF